MAINPVNWFFDFGSLALNFCKLMFTYLSTPLAELLTSDNITIGPDIVDHLMKLLGTFMANNEFLADIDLITLMLFGGFPLYVIITVVGWILDAIPIF